MPTYSYKRPVRVLLDDSSKYVNEHITHFFDVYSMQCLLNASQETRERTFEMVTKHEELLIKLLGETILKSKIFFPKALRDGTDNPLMEEYKKWLDKNEKI